MSIMNGYIITYWEGTQWLSHDEVVGKEDAEEHVQVAMDLGMCNGITMHCIDSGDVLYTYELFRLDGKWVEYINNPLLGIDTIVVL